MNSTLDLFDLSQFDRRKSLDQQKFERTNTNILKEFCNSVPIALEKTHEILASVEPICQHSNLSSTLMSGFLVGNLKKKFPDFCSNDTVGRFRLVTKNTVVYVKKLDKNRRPSNVGTMNSALIYNQRTYSENDRVTNIFLGYTTIDDYSKITGVYAVCIEGEEIKWCSDLTRLPGYRTIPTNIIVAPRTKPRIKAGTIKIRRKVE